MPYNRNLSRVLVIIAHRLGWISFVRPELIREYLHQTTPVPPTKVAAAAGALLGMLSAIPDGTRLMNAPADLQPTLAIHIMVLPFIAMFLGFLGAKAIITARDRWSSFYRKLTDTHNQTDSPFNNPAALQAKATVVN